MIFDIGTCSFEHMSVVDSGGAGGSARQAAEAVVHLIGKRFAQLEFAVGDCSHQRDAAARAVRFYSGRVVGGAGW